MPSSSCAEDVRSGPARLRDIRARRRLTLDALADRVFVSPATISRWEHGLRRPHPAVLPQLAAALAVERSDLIAMFDSVPPAATETVVGGDGLRALRHARVLTRRDLAARVEVAVATIAHWECGRRRIPVSRVPALAAALGVATPELVRRLAHPAVHPPAPKSRLTALRRRAGLTRVTAARLLGVSPRTVSGWESGATRMPWHAAATLADLLDVSPDDVVEASGAGEPAGIRRIGDRSPDWARELVRLGVRQDEVAAWVGVHRQTIARWERARTTPTPDQLDRIQALVRRTRTRRTRAAARSR